MHRKIIRLSKSSIGEREKQAVMGVLDRGYLGMGDEVNQFERLLADYFGRPVLCLTNGTAALQIALQAIGIKSGDEVLVPSLTYIASFQAISAAGGVPVACDISRETLTLDLIDAGKKLTARTRAIMPVHYGGGVGELNEIYKFAYKNNLRVIEDAAHAFGTNYDGKKIGSFGDITCFSFDGIKNITSGEGGCIVSSDKEVIEKARDMRLLSVQRDSDMRYAGKRSWKFDVVEQGWRYHMSNIMAAIGIEQLGRFDDFSLKRKILAKKYDEYFIGKSQIKLIKNNYDDVVPHIYTIQLSSNINRDQIRERLSELGIETGIHYQPNHMLSKYKNPSMHSLKNTERIFPTLVSLPLHCDLTIEDIDYISTELLKMLRNHGGE